MSEEKTRFWVDNAYEKHECYPYDGYVKEQRIRHDGREVTLLLPEFSPGFDVVHTMERDGLLLILAKGHEKFTRGENIGVLFVARRSPEEEPVRGETYIVHVLHSLYPWALKYLGLDA